MISETAGDYLKILKFKQKDNLQDEEAPVDISTGVKRPKRWLLLAIIMISSALTVIYIYNARKVDELMIDIRKYDKQIVEMREGNDYLNYRMKQLMSADRIIPLASEKLNMSAAKEKPKVIEPD